MFVENEMDVLMEVMNEIVGRTEGQYELMSFSDKVKLITISKKLKEMMDRYYLELYPIIANWANLDMADIILEEQEPIFPRFDKDFEKILGGFK